VRLEVSAFRHTRRAPYVCLKADTLSVPKTQARAAKEARAVPDALIEP
jgi:hypothetical protein